MRIIRFIDEQGQTCLGHSEDDRSAAVLDGPHLMALTETSRRAVVVRLLPPVDPAAIICIGLNYRKHAAETGKPLPQHPIVFMKNPAAVIGPGDPIVIPSCCADPPEVDYECELVVVIGKEVKDIPAAKALDYVAGYTIGNDVSARRWQLERGGSQWVRGKSFDTFCPIGPAIVTPDGIPDPQALSIETRINGRVMQSADTSDMIFTVAQIIAFCSQDTTLRPGSIIMTGTPSGVGMARDPQVWLTDGDQVSMMIDGIGQLNNPVAAHH